MKTAQRDDPQHQPADHRGGCCGGSGHSGDPGCRSHGAKADTVARRSELEERLRDLEQELANVDEQLRDLPDEQPEATE